MPTKSKRDKGGSKVVLVYNWEVIGDNQYPITNN